MERMVVLAHKFLEEVLSFGDTAVDLTAGGGRDTLFLAKKTGTAGRVFAFDIQRVALARTASLLREKRLRAVFLPQGGEWLPEKKGIYLVNDGHERVSSYLCGGVKGAIANLGYFPSGDKSIVTRAETTLGSLRGVLPLIVSGGRLAVIAYVGHPGGRQEAEVASRFFEELPSTDWYAQKLDVLNRKSAPFLLMAERAK